MMPVATHLSGPWRCILEPMQSGLRATFSRDAAAGYHYHIEPHCLAAEQHDLFGAMNPDLDAAYQPLPPLADAAE